MSGAVQFMGNNQGYFAHLPEDTGQAVYLRAAGSNTLYFRVGSNGWQQLQTTSDPVFKNIDLGKSDQLGEHVSNVIDSLEILGFTWNEDELKKANLNINHTKGSYYCGFNAVQFEEVIPGTTSLNNYQPDENNEIAEGSYRSIDQGGLISVLAACVYELKALKASNQELISRMESLEGGE
jgi:hypothetical protein